MQVCEIHGRGSLVGKRLDLAMVDSCQGMSRRKAKSLIDNGSVYLNGRKVRIASKSLGLGDCLSFTYLPPSKKKPATIVITKADILLHQSGIIALNKPPGLPSQATGKGDRFHVVNLLQKYFDQQGISLPELSLVHRLDKETSGVLLLAENQTIAQEVMEQFRQKTVKKQYHALCHGVPAAAFSVSCRLSAINPKSGTVKVLTRSGKDSLTSFEVLDSYLNGKLSLLQCEPVTGRSHQIRVHLDHRGHGILGDKVYGSRPGWSQDEVQTLALEHHFLHARWIQFKLPGKEALTSVKAPYPPNWKSILDLLRSQA